MVSLIGKAAIYHVVRRDIKSTNILLDAQMQAKVRLAHNFIASLPQPQTTCSQFDTGVCYLLAPWT